MERKVFTGERALFQAKDLTLSDCTFDDGESPLKHSENITCSRCSFKWKYPFWYAKHIHVKDSVLFEMSRSGLWYGQDLTFEDTMIEAPKEFRRCDGVTLRHVTLPNAQETLWTCRNVRLENVVAKGEYFGKDSVNIFADHLELYGNYCFDGARNIEIHNAKLLSKDSFWNTENVTVCDSYIAGEYLGWNSKNLTFMTFEYSTVDATIKGRVDSILNPKGGVICADEVGTLIRDKKFVNPENTIVLADGMPVKPVSGADVELISGQGRETKLHVRKQNREA